MLCAYTVMCSSAAPLNQGQNMCRSILRRSRAGQSQRAALQLSPTPPAPSRKCMERAPILRAVSAVNVHTLSRPEINHPLFSLFLVSSRGFLTWAGLPGRGRSAGDLKQESLIRQEMASAFSPPLSPTSAAAHVMRPVRCGRRLLRVAGCSSAGHLPVLTAGRASSNSSRTVCASGRCSRCSRCSRCCRAF